MARDNFTGSAGGRGEPLKSQFRILSTSIINFVRHLKFLQKKQRTLNSSEQKTSTEHAHILFSLSDAAHALTPWVFHYNKERLRRLKTEALLLPTFFLPKWKCIYVNLAAIHFCRLVQGLMKNSYKMSLTIRGIIKQAFFT